MCGIFGLLSLDKSKLREELLNKSLDQIHHRGPDGKGIWLADNREVIFGHTRLSIIDLSHQASQPMMSSSGKLVITFNGEIYNFKELKLELDNLKKNTWKSMSDTEVLIELIDYYGLDVTLDKIEGMFAFALYDKFKNIFYLVRDKCGEKPAYYGTVNNNFVFGSDLNSFRCLINFNNKINLNSIKSYFQFSYIKAPLTIYENIYKLEPGQYLKINLNNKINSSEKFFLNQNIFQLNKWWSHEKTYQKEFKKKNHLLIDLENELENELENSTRSQMYADVPMGSFLSGGIDSSIISSFMCKNSKKKIETFTIGFDDNSYDESIYAKKIAKHLGTNHNELILGNSQLKEYLELMPNIYSEPFGDSSQLPTFLLSKFASQKVKVALSGDGGDELFGGYNRYILAKKYLYLIKYLPKNIKNILSFFLSNTPELFWIVVENILNIFKKNSVNLNEKILKISNKIPYILDEKSFFFSMTNQFNQNEKVLNFDNFKFDNEYNFEINNLNKIEEMILQDKITYLPDDILTKVDRASMYCSIETRAPFLTKNLLELSCRIPMDYKIRNNKGKFLLRNILKKHVPENLFERPKMGFGIPIDKWLRTFLKEMTLDTLNLKKIQDQGILNKEYIKKILNAHYIKKKNHGTKIWTILMFQLWYDKHLNLNKQIS